MIVYLPIKRMDISASDCIFACKVHSLFLFLGGGGVGERWVLLRDSIHLHSVPLEPAVDSTRPTVPCVRWGWIWGVVGVGLGMGEGAVSLMESCSARLHGV